ncbi:MAG: PilZ domain-containing protein [Phycisphaerae bacterium]
MSGTRSKTKLITKDYWWRFLQRTVAPGNTRDVRFRRSQRYPLQGELKLTVDGHEEMGFWSLALLEVSLEGLSAKASYDIPVDREVIIELNPDAAHIVMKGRVIHCTQTIGGYKVGIELIFD